MKINRFSEQGLKAGLIAGAKILGPAPGVSS
jgi:hypothetical protein